MESVTVEGLCVAEADTIRDVMVVLQRSARQVALVIDRRDRLVGMITDGDIRRGLLDSLSLDDRASAVMNTHFQFVYEGYEPSLTESMMGGQGVRHLPIVDREGRVQGLLVDTPRKQAPGRSNQVVIMAGGRGSRLRPLTDEVPKPMLRVGGVPILEIIIRGYASQGFRNFTIVTGYLGEHIEQHFADGSSLGVQISYFREAEPLGTAGALAKVVSAGTAPIVVSNADVLSSIDLGSMIDAHVSSGSALTIATRLERIRVPYGLLELDASTVVAWREKPELPVSVSAGIYVVNPTSVSLISHGHADVPDLVHQLLKAGQRVGAHEFEGLWVDVGTHDTLRAAAELGSIMTGEGISR